jgi:glucose/mannose transport system permease protein
MAESAGYDPFASSGVWRRVRGKFVVYLILTVFAVYYLLPLVVVVMNSFRSLPEIAANGLIAFPRSFRSQGLDRGLEHLLHRRHLCRHARQFL